MTTRQLQPLQAESFRADDGSLWCTVWRPKLGDPEGGHCIDFPFECIAHVSRLLADLQYIELPSTPQPRDPTAEAVLMILLRLRKDLRVDLGLENGPSPCSITAEKWQEDDGSTWCSLIQPYEKQPGANLRFDFRRDEIDHFLQLLNGLKETPA